MLTNRSWSHLFVICLLLANSATSTLAQEKTTEQGGEHYDDDLDETTVELEFDIDPSLMVDNTEMNLTNITNSSIVASKKLDQEVADTFKDWLDLKSDELHELNLNNSAYQLLQETYNEHLLKDAEFKWINFTEMILNISKTISEELYNKTLLVEELSKNVEQAYDDYHKDAAKIKESVNFIYYDAKSPKTFCKEDAGDEVSDGTSKPASTRRRRRRRSIPTSSSLDLTDSDDLGLWEDDEADQVLSRVEREVDGHERRRRRRKKKTTTVAPTTTIDPYYDYDYYNDYEYDEYDTDADAIDQTFLADGYWDVECLNRSFDENFKTINTKMNTNYSTMHIPVNVFKQAMAINMTAYWSEELNKQFAENYAVDKDLTWQYFCSSSGLFRRYPAAYWTAPQLEDFFDCRLQSWYIMAAASSKDVLILLDTSGSMTGLRLEIATKLVGAILDTLTDNDFFNIITFATESEYLFETSEPAYANKFIQASKVNKSKFKEMLQGLNTTSQAKLEKPLMQAFTLFNQTSKDRANCNKMMMIITDGHSDDVNPIFDKYNADKRIRVFSYKIGRDMGDPKVIKDLGCNNNGDYYHVVTLTDINEHVYEYIPVLSRPMALNAVHETTWSNVFLGYLDKELKIAVGRPAFVNNKRLLDTLAKQKLFNHLDHLRSLHPLNSTYFENFTNETMQAFISNGMFNDLQEFHMQENLEYEFDSRETQATKDAKIMKQAQQIIKEQVLLGVVGLDVSVLKLISKVSPKFQMGVGIYMIMIDNNGFIVYHPSIKQAISHDSDSKGTSQSIDLDLFEIPINNDHDFETLEHEMIEEITNVRILENWKRQGSRVVRRKTEYVYTSILNTPFAVAIASPESFGRYYIDLPAEQSEVYEEKLRELRMNTETLYDTKIQLYNCSFGVKGLAEKLLNPEKYSDFCIKYLFEDKDQVLALKHELILHDIVYKKFDFSVFEKYPNLVMSSFYGSYSGSTFYLPVTLYRPKSDKPLADNPVKDLVNKRVSDADYLNPKKYEKYTKSANMFGMADNIKNTYSFEKNYYTRAIEFSDYLRTSFNYKEPISIYTLNETTSAIKDANNDTIAASMPIWLNNVPAAVAGSVYNARSFKDRIFGTPEDCTDESCQNICSRGTASSSVTCYLVDEHGIIVLDNQEEIEKQGTGDVIGQLLYKVNPWLMLQLEKDGIYDLIVTGENLQECKKPPIVFSSAAKLFNLVSLMMKMLGAALMQLFQTALNTGSQLVIASVDAVTADMKLVKDKVQVEEHKIDQRAYRISNSHCFYFGIYNFNFTRWQTMDSNELRTWCNKTDGSSSKKYLAGYLKHSNLIMLVVEDEKEVSQCGSIKEMVESRPPIWETRFYRSKASVKTNGVVGKKRATTISVPNNESKIIDAYAINRYRKDPLSYGDRHGYCHNYFPNESMIFKCSSDAAKAVSSWLALLYALALLLLSMTLLG